MFSGLCIDGPLAGQRKTSETARFDVRILEPLSPKGPQSELVTYTHASPEGRDSDTELHIFISQPPADGDVDRYVQTLLMAGFIDSHERRRREKN